MHFKPGIIQGRLLPPINGHIQEFPKDDWRKEIMFAKQIGINHIEWIITKKSFDEGVCNWKINPHQNIISSICCDNLIDKRINDEDFLSKQLRPICHFALQNDIKVISIPLLEDSLMPEENNDEFIKLFQSYGYVYPDLEFHFEMESPVEIALKLLQSCKNFFYTYDTGNLTSCGYDHKEYLETIMPYVKNVHLKDKLNKKTVEPGFGETNFDLIFYILKKYNYNCLFTLQTARCSNGNEVETINRHIKFYEQFI